MPMSVFMVLLLRHNLCKSSVSLFEEWLIHHCLVILTNLDNLIVCCYHLHHHLLFLLLVLLLLQNLYSAQIQACSSRRRWCRWVGKWTSRVE